MGKINLNHFDYDEIGGTKRFKKTNKMSKNNFDGDYSEIKKQYKRKR